MVPIHFYILIASLTIIICRFFLKYEVRNVWFPVLVLNTIPLTTFPFSLTPMYGVDFIAPFLFFVIFRNIKFIKSDSFLRIAFILFIILPIISTLFSLIRWSSESYTWLIYLYRKFAVFLFILYGIIRYKEFNLKQLINTALIFWVLFCFVGFGHYLGFYYADILLSNEEEIEASIFENSWMIQDGFMGLNRGTIGVFSAVFLSIALNRILYRTDSEERLLPLSILVVLSSLVVILASGSRSGIVAAIGGNFIYFVYTFFGSKKIRLKWLLPVIIGVILIIPFLGQTNVLERFSFGASERSGTSRLEIQLNVLENSMLDVQSFLIGNGMRPFSELGQYLTHPHSDYLQVLWDYGWIGLFFYFSLLFTIVNRLGKSNQVVNHNILAGFFASLISGLTIGNLMTGSGRLIVFIGFMITIYTIANMQSKNLDYERS